MQQILLKSLEIARASFPAEEKWASRTFHITCIWDKNRLVSVGENSEKTHPLNSRNNVKNFDLSRKRSCSELKSVLRAKKSRNDINWKKMSIVNIRLGRAGEFLMSRPCIFCQSLFRYINCKSIFYTTNQGLFEKYVS